MSDYDDNDYRGYRRDEWRYGGSSEDAWGAADAEDYYDNGAAEDLPVEHHAAGLSYDPYYDREYGYINPNDYQGDPSANLPPPTPGAAPVLPPSAAAELPPSAQRLRNRLIRRTGPPGTESNRRQRDGIDSLFDMKLSDFRLGGLSGFLPCSPILFVLVVLIIVFACIAMGVLATNALGDLLGL